MVSNKTPFKAHLPAYEPPPQWISIDDRYGHPDYANDLRYFLPRNVYLQRRQQVDPLGFNIRGGAEHCCGIYISRVMEGSEAERLGLREGDQILTVNGVNFVDIEHSQAVHVLKTQSDVQMSVRYFPYGYERTCEKVQPVLQTAQTNAHPSNT